jgi:hypothetical protein
MLLMPVAPEKLTDASLSSRADSIFCMLACIAASMQGRDSLLTPPTLGFTSAQHNTEGE